MVKNNKNNKNVEVKNYVFNIFLYLLLAIIIVFCLLNIKLFINFGMKIIMSLKAVIYGLIMTYIMSPLYNIIVDKLNNNKTFDNSKIINNKKSNIDKKEKSKNNKQKLIKLIATLACVITVLIVVIGLIALVIPQLIISLSNFAFDFMNYQNKIANFVDANDNLSLAEKIPLFHQITAYSQDLMATLSQFFTKIILPKINDIAINFSMGAIKTFKEVLNFLIGIIVMIYVLNMKTNILNALKKGIYAIFDNKIADKILVECRYAHKIFSGFFIGKLLDSLIIGIICYICCLILKMPYSLLISVIVGVTNIIPFFGPFIGAIPSFIFIVLVDPIKGLIFLLFILILQQFDGNVLGPYILGDKTGMESFYVLFSILLFGGLFGFIGMIIGVPLFAVISRLCWQYLDSKLQKKNLSTEINDYEKK